MRRVVGALLCLGMQSLTQPDGYGQFIYWADANFGSPHIGRADLNGNNIITVSLAPQSLPEGLALDLVNNAVFSGDLKWSNAKVRRTGPDLNPIVAIDSGESVIRGIVVDQAGTKLYWTTSNLSTGATIRTALINGTNKQALYSFTAASGANLRGIAVDGTTLYWADFGAGKIRTGDLSGSTPPSDLVTGLNGPVGVALGGDGFLYWTEANGNSIKRRSLSSPTVQLLVSGLSTPNYLTIDPGSAKMYWTEIGIPRIRKADLTGANMQTLGITVVHPTGIVATSSPLPVQLVSFSGTALPGGNVRLTWRTISEVNNYGFYVQRRRSNETAWTEIPESFVPGHGTTQEPHDYTYMDTDRHIGQRHYRLRQLDLDGTLHFSEPIVVDRLTTVHELAPLQFALEQNYPNPFNPTTTIEYALPTDARVTLEVYDLLGRRVAELVNGYVSAGYHSVEFNATSLASGMYFYRLNADGGNGEPFRQMRKLILMK